MVKSNKIITLQDFNKTLAELIEVLETISMGRKKIDSNSDSNISIVTLCGKIRDALRPSDDSQLNQSDAINALLNSNDLRNFYTAAKKYFPTDGNHIIQLLTALLLDNETNASVFNNFANFMAFAAIDFSDSKNAIYTAIKVITKSNSLGGDRLFNGGNYPSHNNNNYFQVLLHLLAQLTEQAKSLEDRELDAIEQWNEHIILLIEEELNRNLAPLSALYNDELLRNKFLIPAIQSMRDDQKQKSLIVRILNKINDIADPHYPADDKKQLLTAQEYVQCITALSDILAIAPSAHASEKKAASSNILAQTFDDFFSTNETFEQNLAVINHYYQDKKLQHYILNALDSLTPQRRLELNTHLNQIIQRSRLIKDDDSNLILNSQPAHAALNDLHSSIKAIARQDFIKELPSLFDDLNAYLDILISFGRESNSIFKTFFSTQEQVEQQKQALDKQATDLKARGKQLKEQRKELSSSSIEQDSDFEEKLSVLSFKEAELNSEIKLFNDQYERFNDYSYQGDNRLADDKKVALIKKIADIVSTLTDKFVIYPESNTENLQKRLQIDGLYNIIKLMNDTAQENSQTQIASSKLLRSFSLLDKKFGGFPEAPNSSLASETDNELFSNTQLDEIKAKFTPDGRTLEQSVKDLLATAQSNVESIDKTLADHINKQTTLTAHNQAIAQLDDSIDKAIAPHEETKKKIDTQVEELTEIKKELTERMTKLDAAKLNLKAKHLSVVQDLDNYFQSFFIRTPEVITEHQSKLDAINNKFANDMELIAKLRREYQLLSDENAPLLNQLQQMQNALKKETITSKIHAIANSRLEDFNKKINYIAEKEQHVKKIASIYTIEIRNESADHKAYVRYREDLLSYAKLGESSKIQDDNLDAAIQSVTQNLKALNEKRGKINELATKLQEQPAQTVTEIANLARTAKNTWAPAVNTAITNLKLHEHDNNINLSDIEENKLDECYISIKKTYSNIASAEDKAQQIANKYSTDPVSVNSINSDYVSLSNLRQESTSLQDDIDQHTQILENEKNRVIEEAYNNKQETITAIDNEIQTLEKILATDVYPANIQTELDNAKELSAQVNAQGISFTNKITRVHLNIKKSNLEDWTSDEQQRLENVEKQCKLEMPQLSGGLTRKLHGIHKEPYDAAIKALKVLKKELHDALPERDINHPHPASTICGFNNTLNAVKLNINQVPIDLDTNLNTAKDTIFNNVLETRNQFKQTNQRISDEVNAIQDTLDARSVKKEHDENKSHKVARTGLIFGGLGGVALCTAIGSLFGPWGALIGLVLSAGAIGVSAVVGKVVGSNNRQKPQPDVPATRQSLIIQDEDPVVEQRARHDYSHAQEEALAFAGGERSVAVEKNSIGSNGVQQFSNKRIGNQTAQTTSAYDCNQMHHRLLAMRR